MKRDLQINYGVLDEIIEQLRKYQYNLETMEESLADVSTYIQTNKGKSMDAWEERITGSKEKIKDYQGQVGDLLSLFENYVADTTTYISPIARNAMMRVDRNDIWFNLKQMEGGIANNVPKALMTTYDSPTSIFNFLDNPTDAEKEASRINQKKIENIRKDIQQTKNSLAYKMDELWNLYTSKVKKFENVDDAYNDKAANVKSKYTNLFESVWDVVEWGSEIVWGLIKGLAVGLYEIAKGLLTLVLDTGIVVLSDTIPDRIEPEGLKQTANDRVETYKQTMQQIISDPMSVVENIGQTVFDAAEDEGIMYVTGVGLTTFVPVVGQVGKGAKGVSALKAISKGSNKNVPTEVFKGTPYSKDFIKQKVTITKTALGKQKVPVFYKEKLATDSVNITTFGMEMKPLSEVNPQMFSVKGAKGTGNTPNKVNYGEQYTKDNRGKVLKPNIEYKTKEGYHYKTDSEGRISNVEATLQLGKADRNNYAQRTVGREDRLPNDDGGHLIASIFKGSGEIDNLVPMNATLNRKEYKALETSWKKALESGKTVEVKIEPIYKGNSSRPSKFEVEYKINGKKYEVNLSNYNGGS